MEIRSVDKKRLKEAFSFCKKKNLQEKEKQERNFRERK